MKALALTLAILLTVVTNLRAAEPASIDLAGTWDFALDPNDGGINAKPDQWRFPDKIQLPGSLNSQGFGDKPNFRTKWTGAGWRYPAMFKQWQTDDNFKMPFFLQPDRHYVGPAWYQRSIHIPPSWVKQHVILHLERAHWQSTVWLDGNKVGSANSLGTPHEFDLGTLPAGDHILTIRVDNRYDQLDVGHLSHSITDHTQGNWNGIGGTMTLTAVPTTHITEATIYASLSKRNIHIVTSITAPSADARLTLTASLAGKTIATAEISAATATAEHTLEIHSPQAWDEFSTSIYQLTATLTSDSGTHTVTEPFGFRDVANQSGVLTLNGHPLSLRGTLDCAIFPNRDYPPTEVEPWKRIMKICKSYGLNHIRYHSWCPPEAAFIAADEIGVYLQVECSAWATIGDGKPLDEWICAEAKRMSAAYGNHPSFLMMAYGNEPKGSNHKYWLQTWMIHQQETDSRRIYTTAAGWPVVSGSDFHNIPEPRIQRWGEGIESIINAEAPRTDFDWGDVVKKHLDAPVVSHEIGQWCVYPDFDEMKKYTGYLKPKNFEIFQETARHNHLLDQAHDFVMASGKLQTLCYKHDIEAALRTWNFGGFQLLGLQDFPGQGTALVGVVDPFWDAKEYVTPAEFHQFCAPTVPLAKFPKMTWTTSETLTADLELYHFASESLTAYAPQWTITTNDAKGSKVLASGTLPARDLASYQLHQLGNIEIALKDFAAPAQIKFTLTDAAGTATNHWDIFVYPESNEPAPVAPLITADLDAALDGLAAGKNVFWNPPTESIANDPNRPLVSGFSTIFWNTAWTNWQAPHTLGILVAPNNPALAKFPTQTHSNWQWWEIQRGAQPFILTPHKNLKPIVQVIDDWFTNRRLGLVFEAKVGNGKLIASSADLTNRLDQRPVARQLRASLLDYMGCDTFAPATSLTPADLHELLMKHE